MPLPVNIEIFADAVEPVRLGNHSHLVITPTAVDVLRLPLAIVHQPEKQPLTPTKTGCHGAFGNFMNND